MLRVSKQLVFKADYLKFENKGLMEALKAKKKNKNKGKKLNLLDEEDDNLPLFSLSRV